VLAARASGRHFLSALAASLALGCGGSNDGAPKYDGPPIPWAYQAFPEIVEPADNHSTPEKIELGRLLFYDPILSLDRAVACATCHSEVWGMSDGLPQSVGIGGEGPTGPGRTGPNVTRRNAQTLWNVAYRAPVFWDGRSPSLEEQVLAPLGEPIELGRDPLEIASELGNFDGYVTRFAAAFPGEPITPLNITRAIAAFERTIVSSRAPYDHYVRGDAGALSEATIAGMFLFGEAGCASCHTPPLFESEIYADRGIAGGDDLGRFEVSGDPTDRGKFRVPTLRNVRDSEPYFHDGSVQTLDAAVRHEVGRSVLDKSSRALSDAEIALVVRFLDKALTDQSSEPARPKSVPSGLAVPVDGFRVPR
jgi:cytochrome c peroxidase